jgi:NitT/TauT family transport system substrate-binding protein
MSRKLLLLVVLLLSITSVTRVSAQEEEMTFLLTFIPNIQFAPVYVAIEKGYFAEAGAENVKLDYLEEPDVANSVADNRTQFGVVSGEQVILARSADRPIVFVYEWFQKFPVGIVTPTNTGIESVTDLAGHKVGIPGRFGASLSGMVALLTANDMTESDIQLETIGFTAPDTVCVGYKSEYAQGVEAAVVYINNEPLQIEQKCSPVHVFPVSDYVDIVSNGLITNEETIADNPELVTSIVGAFNGGLRDTINNPAEAYLLSAAHVETLALSDELKAALEDLSAQQTTLLEDNPDREAVAESRDAMWTALTEQFDAAELVEFRVLLNTIELWDADQLGYTDPASWEVTQDNLIQMEFLAAPLEEITKAYTNDFLSGE